MCLKLASVFGDWERVKRPWSKGPEAQKPGPGRAVKAICITLNKFWWPRLSLLLPYNRVPMETCFPVSKGLAHKYTLAALAEICVPSWGMKVAGAKRRLSRGNSWKPMQPWGPDACILCLLHRSARHHLHGRDNHEARGDRAGDGENPASPGSLGPAGVWAQVYVSAWGRWRRKGRGVEGEDTGEPDIYCLLLCARHRDEGITYILTTT